LSAVVIRPGTPDDRAHVGESFWRDYSATLQARGTPAKVLAAKLNAILDAPGWALDVACSSEEPTYILGWFLHSTGFPQRAAWVHVRPEWTGKGVARALLKHAGFKSGNIEVAFVDPDVAKWAARKGLTLRLRPHIAEVCAYDRDKEKANARTAEA
jgi:GNAT superfamily N-acetyltransferase